VITIEEGLQAFLAANAGLVALISGRVYHRALPQGVVLPALTWQRISTPRLAAHDTSGSTGTAHPRFQFDAWATTYASAKAITDALRAALNGYKGTMGALNPVTVQGALVDNERENSDPDTGLEWISSDYIIWHEE